MTAIADLPPVLGAYFSAQNDHDIDRLVACFSADARVRDEGQDIAGPAEIRAWEKRTSERYKVQVEPLGMERNGGDVTVVARVSGTFPGSPADLTYRFGLAGDSIRSLEIG